MSDCKYNTGQPVKLLREGRWHDGVIVHRCSTGDYACSFGGLTEVFHPDLIFDHTGPASLPGGDDCCNRPLADPGFDELAPAAEDAPAPGFDAEVLEAVLMETVEVLAVAEMAAIDAPAACALAVGLASRKLESLIEDAREAIRDARAAK